jgi:hypothetical protein
MGNQLHNTHVTNGLDRSVLVVITHPHPNERNDKLHVDPGKTRNVPTAQGNVTISVYDPASTDPTPYECRNLPSDRNVYIDKNAQGKPKIRFVEKGSLRECIGSDGIYK